MCSHVTAAILHRQGRHPLSQIAAAKEDFNRNLEAVSRLTTTADSEISEWEVNWVSPPSPKPSVEEEDEEVEEEALLDSTSSTPLPSELGSAFDPPLPTKFASFQHEQWKTVTEIAEAFEAGFKVVMLDAPTGSGKTLIAESVRRLMEVRAIYTCTTKTLQDQVHRDFGSYARVVKGRANYTTFDNPDSGYTAADCTKKETSLPACENCPGWTPEMNWMTAGSKKKIKGQQAFIDNEDSDEEEADRWHCSHCHPMWKCSYTLAKLEAARAPLAILNTAYFLAENNYVQKTPFRNWELVVLDEADRLEEELMGFVELEISARMRKKLGIGLPAKKTVEEEWVRWLVETVLPAVKNRLTELGELGLSEVEYTREKKTLFNLSRNIRQVLEQPVDEAGVRGDPVLQSGWVYTGYEKDDDAKANVVFKPIKVDTFAQSILWSRAKRFLLMSASFVSPEQTAEDLGLEDGEWTVVSMDSTFPPIQRPIFPVDVASVNHKTKDETYPKIARAMERILDNHLEERVLIHTVSYDLGRVMFEWLNETKHNRRLVTYRSADNRQGALTRYLSDPRAVLLAPSFDRGVDLSGDDCRVIIVPKVPFGYLGDKQISSRFYGTGRSGKQWYKVQAIRTLCQMTGRGMRSSTDYCTTYILDSEFSRLYGETRRLFPSWWSEAIVWDEYDPRWKGVKGSVIGLVDEEALA